MAVNQLGDGSADGVKIPGPINGNVGFYGTTPVAQPTNPGNAHTTAAGATTSVFTNTAFDGGVGSKGYTIGDIVLALKSLGLIAS
jgi:hypothetical protein